jgi:hypothetical protein
MVIGKSPVRYLGITLLFIGAVAAQDAQSPDALAPAGAKAVSGSQKISYAAGRLRIEAVDSTLKDILTKVATVTGVKLDLPPMAGKDTLHLVDLGPGSPRQVVADLLAGSGFDYLIVASDSDPEVLRDLVLIPRDKKGNGSAGPMSAPVHSPFGRSVEAARADDRADATAVTTEHSSTETSSLAAAASTTEPPSPSSTQPDTSVPGPLVQPDVNAGARPGAMAPPVAMNSQNIGQQLQQMYQQRMQMIQQDHPQGATPASPGPGK